MTKSIPQQIKADSGYTTVVQHCQHCQHSVDTPGLMDRTWKLMCHRVKEYPFHIEPKGRCNFFIRKLTKVI